MHCIGDREVEKLYREWKAAQRVVPAGSHLSPRLEGQRRRGWYTRASPGGPPPQSPAARWIFHASRLGVCSSTSRTEHARPSPAVAMGRAASSAQLARELQKLGCVHRPYSAQRESRGLLGRNTRDLGRELRTEALWVRPWKPRKLKSPPHHLDSKQHQPVRVLSSMLNQPTDPQIFTKAPYVTLVLLNSKPVRWVLLYNPILQMGKLRL